MKRIALSAPLALVAGPAFAHLSHAEHGSLAAGFTHPLFGLDHVLAMVAVGLWAATLGGRAVLAVPAAFLGAMIAGFALALAGLALPAVEPMILASIVILGLLLAFAVRLDARIAMAAVAVLALFHGHAHGGELGGAGALSFAAGFAAATSAILAAGIGLGLVLMRNSLLARVLGGATALAGAALALG